ncbi:MAG: flagellar motor switch protein FliN [Pseudomonadota bacterium]
MTAFSPALHRFGDVTVRLSVELGRADMALRDVLALTPGSVVPLNRLTDELLDVTANGKVIAHGEVVAQDGRFALRIVSLAGEEASDEPDAASDFPAGAPSDFAQAGKASAPPEGAQPPVDSEAPPHEPPPAFPDPEAPPA